VASPLMASSDGVQPSSVPSCTEPM
jgi:hypothetical protein